MTEVLSLIADFIFAQMNNIWALYAGGSVLGLAVILWILDHFLDFFDILKR